MRQSGRYFDGVSSRAAAVDIVVYAGRLKILGEGVDREVELHEITASERLGRTARILRLPDGATLELADSDALETALAPVTIHGAPRFVFALERQWLAVAIAVVVTVVVMLIVIRDGVPALAEFVAHRIPPEVSAELGTSTLDALDDEIFGSTELDAETRGRLGDRFDALADSAGLGQNLSPRLEFRRGSSIGANAFALPSGIVVVTDELVALAEEEAEVVAVMAHELGHVRHRHGLRSVLQSVGIGVLVAGALGDFVSIGSLAGALPLLLVQMQYSRGFESEADDFGGDLLERIGLEREHLAAMLERLGEAHGDSGLASYLSTHPATDERVAEIRRAAGPVAREPAAGER